MRPRVSGCAFDLLRFAIHKGDTQGLAGIGITQHALGASVGFQGADADGKLYLQLIHAGMGLVAVNGAPGIWGPVLVKLVRVLIVEKSVGEDLVVAINYAADGEGIGLAFFFEDRQQLLARAMNAYLWVGVRNGLPLHAFRGR